MSVRLFVDDERPVPDNSWVLVTNSPDALAVIKAQRRNGQKIEAISLDHDLSNALGYDDNTRPIMLYMCEHNYWPKSLYVHTSNPAGEQWLVGMAKRYGPRNMLKGFGSDYWKARQ